MHSGGMMHRDFHMEMFAARIFKGWRAGADDERFSGGNLFSM